MMCWRCILSLNKALLSDKFSAALHICRRARRYKQMRLANTPAFDYSVIHCIFRRVRIWVLLALGSKMT